MPPDAMTITRLVRMGPAHLEATYGWLAGSPELRQRIDSLAPPTREGNAAYWQANWQDPSREDYAVLDAVAGHVGNCGIRDIDRQRRKAQGWIYLGSGQARGTGTRAMRLLLDRAFLDLSLNRVYLRVVAGNPEARRFYARLGFVVEGCLRADTCIGERFVDATMMSILADEYRVARSAWAP